MQSVPNTTYVVSSNLEQDKVYNIRFVSGLRQVGGFLRPSSGYLHQLNWPPQYNWNIVESGVKHRKTSKQCKIENRPKHFDQIRFFIGDYDDTSNTYTKYNWSLVLARVWSA